MKEINQHTKKGQELLALARRNEGFCLSDVYNTPSYSKRQAYAIQRLIGQTPNQLVKLIVAQILLFITYSIVAGSIVGCTLTYALAMIDSTGALYFDVQTITMVSVGFIVLSILLFAGKAGC